MKYTLLILICLGSIFAFAPGDDDTPGIAKVETC